MNWTFLQRNAGNSALATYLAAGPADKFVETYVCWREESDAVRTAYERWRTGERRDRGLAYAAYRAALDREEHAAVVFRERVERVSSSSS